jgi:environmental stress-induced protein Ves
MQKLDPATFRTMPWKNGRGTTTLALALPEGASFETFDLRISMAEVARDGPFSELPGVDRTLVVTSGAGLVLETADGAEVPLDTTSPPFSFTGDDPVTARLMMGPVRDLNVMTRRSVFHHEVSRVRLDAACSLEAEGELSVVVLLEGEAVARSASGEASWVRGDVVVVSPDDPPVLVETRSPLPAALLLIDVFRNAEG